LLDGYPLGISNSFGQAQIRSVREDVTRAMVNNVIS
jgi:hypothetical protein